MNLNALSVITMVTGLGAVVGGAAYGAHLGEQKHRELGAALGATAGIVAGGVMNVIIIALTMPAVEISGKPGVAGNLKQPSAAEQHLRDRCGMLAGAIPIARG